jgi:protein-disulfide isomerase
MSAKPPASLFDVLTPKKSALLLTPAILLLGATLAAGQNPTQGAVAQSPQATTLPAATSQASNTFSPAQKTEIEAIIKDYLVNNPEVLMEANTALEAKMDKIQAERMAAALKDNSAELFRPTASPIVGNAKGDVTMIEFFDYNCGYCRKAFPDVARVVDTDKQIKLILKEFPILAKGSEEASRVALAAKLQGKYWEFHRAMLANPGQANEAAALHVAEKIAGIDMARLKKDMASSEVKKEIDDTRKLATKMGIQGTPHFIIGDRVIPGAPENLTELIDKDITDVRKEGCKIC